MVFPAYQSVSKCCASHQCCASKSGSSKSCTSMSCASKSCTSKSCSSMGLHWEKLEAHSIVHSHVRGIASVADPSGEDFNISGFLFVRHGGIWLGINGDWISNAGNDTVTHRQSWSCKPQVDWIDRSKAQIRSSFSEIHLAASLEPSDNRMCAFLDTRTSWNYWIKSNNG